MKIFAFTDFHANPLIFERIKKKVQKEKPDVILFAGDMAFLGSSPKNWLKKFDSLAIPTYIIPGNSEHETEEEVEVYSRNLKFVKDIHLKSVMFKSVLLIGCGSGGFTEQHTEFEKSEKKFEKKIKKLKIKDNKQKTILIVHQPPYGTKLDDIHYFGHVGSKSIRTFIEKYQPELCISGHLHENFGKEDKIKRTKIINPGPEGQIITI